MTQNATKRPEGSRVGESCFGFLTRRSRNPPATAVATWRAYFRSGAVPLSMWDSGLRGSLGAASEAPTRDEAARKGRPVVA
jgi:hypothetical protein